MKVGELKRLLKRRQNAMSIRVEIDGRQTPLVDVRLATLPGNAFGLVLIGQGTGPGPAPIADCGLRSAD